MTNQFDRREQAMAIRYQQSSAEVKALQQQCYALATMRMRAVVDEAAGVGDGLAIISDIDETILDNTAVMAHVMSQEAGVDVVDRWKLWERTGQPALIPGAANFFALADNLGLKIFYVSDRFEENKSATLATLSVLGLPQVCAEQVLLCGPPKAMRRAAIARDYRIVLQLGDSMHDFHGDFANASLPDQHDHIERYLAHFGTEWIVFPNAAHGTWMEAEVRSWQMPG